jgi:survival-of-motor-neuron-related-splicing factor 30
VGSRDIRPIHGNDSRKRKADATHGGTSRQSPPPQNTNGTVISAEADINPDLARQVKTETNKATDGPIRPSKVQKKIKPSKALEVGKSKWQDFTAKGKSKGFKSKDSMFRTPDGINGKGKILDMYFDVYTSSLLFKLAS